MTDTTDKNQAIINPHKANYEDVIAKDVIILCNPFLIPLIREIFPSENIKPKKLEFYSRYDFDSTSYPFSILGPALGAPASVLVLEKAIALGGTNFYILGTCGALKKNVPISSIILPQEAIIDEGTSKHYYPNLTSSFPSQKILNKLEIACQKKSVNYSKGKIWTTDAPYRETQIQVQKYQDQLALGVEMEISALFSVARFRNVDLGAILVVSDELYNYKWNPGYSLLEYKKALRDAFKLIIEAI